MLKSVAKQLTTLFLYDIMVVENKGGAKMKHYYVIELNPITHRKTEKPLEYYDFFCRHEKGNVTGEELIDYDDVRDSDKVVAFIEDALNNGYDIQSWNSWKERVYILGVVKA